MRTFDLVLVPCVIYPRSDRRGKVADWTLGRVGFRDLVTFSAHVSPPSRLDGAVGCVYRSLRFFIGP